MTYTENKQCSITQLRDDDVLFGRGTGPNEFEGNVRYRQLVQETLAWACNPDVVLDDATSANARRIVMVRDEERQGPHSPGAGANPSSRGARPSPSSSSSFRRPPPNIIMSDQASSKRLLERNTFLATKVVQTIHARNGRFLQKVLLIPNKKISSSSLSTSTTSSSLSSKKRKFRSRSTNTTAMSPLIMYQEVDEAVAIEKTKQTFRHQMQVLRSRFGTTASHDGHEQTQIKKKNVAVAKVHDCSAPLSGGVIMSSSRVSHKNHDVSSSSSGDVGRSVDDRYYHQQFHFPSAAPLSQPVVDNNKYDRDWEDGQCKKEIAVVQGASLPEWLPATSSSSSSPQPHRPALQGMIPHLHDNGNHASPCSCCIHPHQQPVVPTTMGLGWSSVVAPRPLVPIQQSMTSFALLPFLVAAHQHRQQQHLHDDSLLAQHFATTFSGSTRSLLLGQHGQNIPPPPQSLLFTSPSFLHWGQQEEGGGSSLY